MAKALHVYIVRPDGTIAVEHIFYGETEQQCEEVRDAHLGVCEAFSLAHEEDKTIEELELEVEIPTEADFEDEEEEEEAAEGEPEEEEEEEIER